MALNLRKGIVPPTHTNKWQTRGGASTDKGILDSFVVEDNDWDQFETWQSLQFQGWTKFLKSKNPIHDSLIEWFYRHVEITTGGVGENPFCSLSVVCGKRKFIYNEENFAQDFDLDFEGFHFYDGNVWPEDMIDYADISRELNVNVREDDFGRRGRGSWLPYLSGDNKFAMKIIRNCILPSSSNASELTLLETIVLYRLNHRMKMNLPFLIVSHMDSALNRNNVGLYPYGMLICHIVLQWKLFSELGMGKPPKVIGPQTLVKQRLEFRDGHLVVSQAKGKRRRSNATREDGPSNFNEERRSNVVREDGPSNVNEEGGEHGQEARLFEGLTAPFDDFGSLPEERNDYHIAQKMDEIIVNQRIILAEQESIRREQREMRSCMSGLLRFLKCQHRKSGCSEEELKDLDEPSSSAN